MMLGKKRLACLSETKYFDIQDRAHRDHARSLRDYERSYLDELDEPCEGRTKNHDHDLPF
jgi:hypothetical protein